MNLRTLGMTLLMGVSVFLLAGANASATTLTSFGGYLEPDDTVYTGNIVAESEGHVVFHNPISTINCASKIEGTVETHGAEAAAEGKVGLLSFTGCTNSWHVTVVSAGSLAVQETSGGDGTVTSNGATVEATRFGITCRYATSNTEIGTLTGTYTSGDNATIDINANIPFHSGSPLCGSGATAWTGSYVVTAPSALSVSQPNPTPNIGAKAKNGAPLKAGNEDEFTLSDKSSLVGYTLLKVQLAIDSGGWELKGAPKCAGIGVNIKEPKELCKIEVKCITAGVASIQLDLMVGAVTGIRLFELTCT